MQMLQGYQIILYIDFSINIIFNPLYFFLKKKEALLHCCDGI